MKILKKILLVLVGIVALALVAAAILPKSYDVKVSKTYNLPQQQLFDYIKMLGNQKEYSEWLKPDPKISIEQMGTDGTKGAKMRWAGNADVGEGMQEILAIDSSKIEVEIIFYAPLASTAQIFYHFKKLGPNSTELTLNFKGDSPFPMNLMSHLIGVPMIKSTTEKNFENIETLIK